MMLATGETTPMEQSTGEDVTRLADELGATLRRVLSESTQVAHLLERVRAEGYHVSVVLDASLSFSRSDGRDSKGAHPLEVRVEKPEKAPLKMTPLDKKFLRSLKITVEEEE